MGKNLATDVMAGLLNVRVFSFTYESKRKPRQENGPASNPGLWPEQRGQGLCRQRSGPGQAERVHEQGARTTSGLSASRLGQPPDLQAGVQPAGEEMTQRMAGGKGE